MVATLAVVVAAVAAFAIIVVMPSVAAFTVIVMMSAAVSLAVVVSAAVTSFVSAVALSGCLDLVLRGLAYRYHLPLEIERLACHGVVEVHRHVIVLDLDYLGVANLSGRVEHRDHLSYYQEVLADFPVNSERLLGDVETQFGVALAISLLGRKGECEVLSGLLSFNFFLEAGYEHIAAVDVLQRLCLGC